jgi:hypothetical protein
MTVKYCKVCAQMTPHKTVPPPFVRGKKYPHYKLVTKCINCGK